ncbi:MAG: ribosomal protein [Pseudomonadota bacterium]|jgi:small subunit ribosomal protein S2
MSVSIKEMLEAGVHFGHQTKYWNPKMKSFIFGSRNKIHIINLDKTLPMLQEAIEFTKQTVKNKGFVLFVGAKAQASEIISEEAQRCGMPFVDHRWLGGMLTNFETVKKSIKKLETKSAILEQADNGLSKKELLNLEREVEKLQKTIGGISEMKGLPSAIFVVDTGVHHITIQEAQKLGIPVIGVVDTNNDPSGVDYIIPGNDDSARAIKLYTTAIADAILEAKEQAVVELAKSIKVEMVEEQASEEAKTVRIKKSADDSAE